MSGESDPQMLPFDRILESYPTTARKIIKNIPLHLRFNVGAINKQFYETVCDMDKHKYAIKIKGEVYEDEEEGDSIYIDDDVVSSILNSQREFDELQLDNLEFNYETLDQLMEIADKYGKGIVKLQMSECVIDYQSYHLLFGQFLEKLPHLEHWIIVEFLKGWKKKGRHHRDDTPEQINIEIQPVLKNLKKLDVMMAGRDNEWSYFWTKFIANDTLHHFNFMGYAFDDVQSFILHQSNLRSLKFSESYSYHPQVTNAGYFRHMKNLEEITFAHAGNKFFQKFIPDHPALKKFSFEGLLNWNEETLSTIYNHAAQLQALNVEMNDNNCIHLLELPRLKNLREIEVIIYYRFSKFDVFKDFSKLNMPTVKVLILDVHWEKSTNDLNEALENFGRHWENVEELKYKGCPSYCEHSNIIDVDRILLNFRKLKSLKLCDRVKFDNEEKYPKMEELELEAVNPTQLVNLLKALPTLGKLHIDDRVVNQVDNTMFHILQILASHDKLKNLEIKFFFKETSKNARNYFEAVKKLCRKLSKFNIGFDVNEKRFCNKILGYIRSAENDFCKVIIYTGTSSNSLALINY